MSSVFGSALCQSGRPRHSLHGKPAVFTAATSRFTAIMSQLFHHTRGLFKMQEHFLYLSTNIFVIFHKDGFLGDSCQNRDIIRELLLDFNTVFLARYPANVLIRYPLCGRTTFARSDPPCHTLRFQGGEAPPHKKAEMAPNAISAFFTLLSSPPVKPERKTGYILPHVSFPSAFIRSERQGIHPRTWVIPRNYFFLTSSNTSVIAFEGAAVILETMTLAARLIRNAGSSS